VPGGTPGAEAEARERFERWQREALDDRRRYHALCGYDKKEADSLAHQEMALLSIDVREGLDRLVAHHWQTFTRRLSMLLRETAKSEG
jgi:hypothetical protein